MGNDNIEKYLIRDDLLKRPYVSEQRESFLFLSETMAIAFCRKRSRVTPLKITKYTLVDIQSVCFAAGAEKLVMVDQDEDSSTQVIELERKNLNRRYYNSRLNALIGYQLTLKGELPVKAFAYCRYIVAVKLNKNSKQYMMYASVRNKRINEVAMIAFSDLVEFEKWKEKYGSEYEPMEVDFLGLHRIGGKHGFLFNPEGIRFFMSPKFIEKVAEESNLFRTKKR